MTDIYQKAYTSIYPSRLGDILLAADEIGLTGLWFFRYTSGRANCAGNADTGAGKGMAGRIFFGKRTGLYTDAASDGIAVSAGSVEAFAADSLWSDDDLWRDRKTAGKAAEPASYVCAGGRRCGGT